ncbi:hypothetical protein DPMN_066663 [Dreissena polymorpha]|uniref:Uncharacterized protein n=1 Tax=Dreissena polymorpha TaxID=45954 RepID=A0A9D3YUG0_DREPO|nr:hypothetical protein DPMN_066663 [Dreissena polymorpha]
MRNCSKSVTEKSIISLGDLDPSDLRPHQKVEVKESIEGAMGNCNKSVTEKSIISLGDLDLDPSDLKSHEKVEVPARYANAKYERDR